MDEKCDEKHTTLCKTMDRIFTAEMDALIARIDGMDKATVIQTNDLREHLKILNGHQAELKSFQTNFVPIDRFEDKIKSLDTWITMADRKIEKLVVEQEKRISKANIIALFAIGVSIVSVIFHFFYNMR